MREIKFRCFSRKLKNELGRADVCDVVSIDFEKGIVTFREKTSKNLNSDYMTNLEFIEYTGYKDINGVEIYKGDIAKIENEYTDEYIDEVYFYKGTWTFGDLYLDEIFIDFNKLKVIGNKFENPELLEAIK